VSLNGDNLVIENNPFSSALNLAFYSDYRQTINVRLVDMLGKIVYQQDHIVSGLTINKIEIPASFSKGIYVVEVASENKTFAKKVVKN
jgi:hypothetical protein